MLAIKNTLAAENVEIEETNNEMIWVRIKLKCQNPLFICSFYRSNKVDDPKPLDDLSKALDHVSELSANNTQTTVCVAGDFNAGDIDGARSKPVDVMSGVPQGTVLGPLLFLLHINDLPSVVASQVRLFADDCLMYRPIRSIADQVALQRDLSALER